VLSSLAYKPGSLVVDEDEIMEKPIVSGIAYSRDEAKVPLRRVPDRPGIAATVFGELAKANVNVDMIVQNISADGTTDMTFTVGKADLPRAHQAFASVKGQIGYAELLEDPNVAKISVVGVGMRSHAGVANTMFKALADRKRIEEAVDHLRTISGQKPMVTKSRIAVSGFRLREGVDVGCKVTLRGDRMYDFIDRLVTLALPRVRDFRGVRSTGFDGNGNFSMGLNEQTVFPEIDPDKVTYVQGMNIAIVTTAKNDAEALVLLKEIGIPFVKEQAV